MSRRSALILGAQALGAAAVLCSPTLAVAFDEESWTWGTSPTPKNTDKLGRWIMIDYNPYCRDSGNTYICGNTTSQWPARILNAKIRRRLAQTDFHGNLDWPHSGAASGETTIVKAVRIPYLVKDRRYDDQFTLEYVLIGVAVTADSLASNLTWDAPSYTLGQFGKTLTEKLSPTSGNTLMVSRPVMGAVPQPGYKYVDNRPWPFRDRPVRLEATYRLQISLDGTKKGFYYWGYEGGGAY
jgi:hypothetical protein